MANVFSWPAEQRSRFVELVALQSLFPHADRSSKEERTAELREWEAATDRLAGWRVLPARAEREVADHVAFLADADVGAAGEYTSAVCVEPRTAGGLVLRLAMHEGLLNEGVPTRIVAGLNGLCRQLEKAAASPNGSSASPPPVRLEKEKTGWLTGCVCR